MEQMGLKLEPKWDTGIVGSGFICYATVLASLLFYFLCASLVSLFYVFPFLLSLVVENECFLMQ